MVVVGVFFVLLTGVVDPLRFRIGARVSVMGGGKIQTGGDEDTPATAGGSEGEMERGSGG